MRNTILIATIICVFLSPALGVNNHDNTAGDQKTIDSTVSSSSATTAVGPNGTEYSSKVSMEGRVQENTEDRIREESVSSSGVKFNGTVEAATPCHVLEQEITEKEGDDGYIMNIKTVEEQAGNGSCAQSITGINYIAEFEEDVGITVEVQHNGEKLKTYDTVSDEGGKNESESSPSIVQVILGFLGSL